MNELLEKLLAAEVLTEDTKNELKTAIETQINEAREAARAEVTAQVTEQLHSEWVSQRDVLIEALDTQLSEVLESELKELRSDIESFRDLEAEYGERIVEAKASMATQLATELEQLSENLDVFLEMRLTEELKELRESVEAANRLSFGQKIFEAFRQEFETNYTNEDSVYAKLADTEARLEATARSLAAAERTVAESARAQKLARVLAPLADNSRAREVMEAILRPVDTARLEEAYATYIGRVLKEHKADAQPSEMETPVLAEGKKEAQVRGVIKTGDDSKIISESKQVDAKEHQTNNVQAAISSAELFRLRRAAGIN